jgi:hypothetical protein
MDILPTAECSSAGRTGQNACVPALTEGRGASRLVHSKTIRTECAPVFTQELTVRVVVL